MEKHGQIITSTMMADAHRKKNLNNTGMAIGSFCSLKKIQKTKSINDYY